MLQVQNLHQHHLASLDFVHVVLTLVRRVDRKKLNYSLLGLSTPKGKHKLGHVKGVEASVNSD